jgi:hypothetical protein
MCAALEALNDKCDRLDQHRPDRLIERYGIDAKRIARSAFSFLKHAGSNAALVAGTPACDSAWRPGAPYAGSSRGGRLCAALRCERSLTIEGGGRPPHCPTHMATERA